MLVLARKEHERIRIGEDIEIVVIECRKGGVRIGIRCPAEIPVHRQEVYEKIMDLRLHEMLEESFPQFAS